jgi:hypothetical protein
VERARADGGGRSREQGEEQEWRERRMNESRSNVIPALDSR